MKPTQRDKVEVNEVYMQYLERTHNEQLREYIGTILAVIIGVLMVILIKM